MLPGAVRKRGAKAPTGAHTRVASVRMWQKWGKRVEKRGRGENALWGFYISYWLGRVYVCVNLFLWGLRGDNLVSDHHQGSDRRSMSQR